MFSNFSKLFLGHHLLDTKGMFKKYSLLINLFSTILIVTKNAQQNFIYFLGYKYKLLDANCLRNLKNILKFKFCGKHILYI